MCLEFFEDAFRFQPSSDPNVGLLQRRVISIQAEAKVISAIKTIRIVSSEKAT
jgi:hypothetical protein